MKKSASKKRILWSFNPFQNDPKVLKNAVALLKLLSRQTGLKVEPVYVVSPAEVNVVLEFSVPAKDRYQAVAKLECEKILKKIQFPGLLPPTVLVENQVRLSASAKALAAYAQKTEAYAIVIGTHGKSGLGRALLGSFAETLLYHAKTPVLLVNPHLRAPAALKHFLFASDFSAASRQAFGEFCAFLKPLKAKATLYHIVPKPFPWASPATAYLLGTQTLNEAQYLREVARENLDKAEEFQKVAKKAGVPCEVRLETSDEDVAAAILKRTKGLKADGVGLAAQTGRWETALLGSTSRGLLREGRIPVWVLRAS
ncbi:MAG: universal stress protein [Deltaproteobacteria bacterium]|nr:universal stress protein [Deltaproteobacteria bacterium]